MYVKLSYIRSAKKILIVPNAARAASMADHVILAAGTARRQELIGLKQA